ncbi:MAG: TIM-barrel domain-containing protein [Acidimicrobiales bacterium]
MISRTDLRRAWHLGAAVVRSAADLGPSTTGLVIVNTIVQGVKGMARETRGKRRAEHVLPGLLTRYEDSTDGASFYFERACLEVRFVTSQIVRITWTPGLLPVAYGPRVGWPGSESSGVQVACASIGDGGFRISSSNLSVRVSSGGAVSFSMNALPPPASPSPAMPPAASPLHFENEWVLRRDLPPSRVGEGWELPSMLRHGEIVCGLGEKSSGVNLRNQTGTTSSTSRRGTERKHYRLWNRDPGGLWGPGVDPLYMSIPFTISMDPGKPGMCTGCFYENSWESIFSFPGDISAGPTGAAPSIASAPDGEHDGSSGVISGGASGDVSGNARAGIPCNTDVARAGTSSGAEIHGDEQLARIKFAGGALRYYLTAGSPAEVLEQYTDMTGRPPLPPRWALGYHQSRWGYKTERHVRSIAKGFESMNIPVSAIHLDIDYMDGYKVFTIDRERFPAMSSLCEDLAHRGIRIVTILDPAVKASAGYDTYEEGLSGEHFCKDATGRVQLGVVWPGKAAFPDFTSAATRQWWASKYELFAGNGIGGVWHDMNEPTNISLLGDKTLPLGTMHAMEGRSGVHGEAHNLYALQMNRAGYDGLRQAAPQRRPFIISRSGWAGSQRYAWGWTGDTKSTWEALRQQIPTIIGLGMSGFPFSGSDIGGFNGAPDAELYLRWLQVGVCMPLFRTHSVSGVPPREPWRLPEAIQPAVAGYIRFRYRLLPYLYTLAHEASKTGMPLVRPLGWMSSGQDPDPLLWEVDDAFMLGGALLVAPITSPSRSSRTVRLPDGCWSSLWEGIGYPAGNVGNGDCGQGNGGSYRGGQPTGSELAAGDDQQTRQCASALLGGRVVRLPGDLAEMPVLVRTGTVIPLDDGWSDGQPGQVDLSHRPELLSFHVWPDEDGNASGVCYDDDGDGYGESRLDRITFSCKGDAAAITWERSGSYTPPDRVSIVLHGMAGGSASADGHSVEWDASKVICQPFSTMHIENIRRALP